MLWRSSRPSPGVNCTCTNRFSYLFPRMNWWEYQSYVICFDLIRSNTFLGTITWDFENRHHPSYLLLFFHFSIFKLLIESEEDCVHAVNCNALTSLGEVSLKYSLFDHLVGATFPLYFLLAWFNIRIVWTQRSFTLHCANSGFDKLPPYFSRISKSEFVGRKNIRPEQLLSSKYSSNPEKFISFSL